jgi:coniferyl-aldehyde dehydrogenase
MNAPVSAGKDNDIGAALKTQLDKQRKAFLDDGFPDAETRIDRLDRGIDVLYSNRERIVEALDSDFGCRSREVSLITDVAASLQPLKHARKHLRDWMRGEKRPTVFPLNLLGGRSRVEYQPLGVVGVISPWNFPVNLTFAPLAGILAAGNRAMVKPSEFTPATSALMAEMIAEAWGEDEVAVAQGGPEVGQAFAGLPFDHLLFTGATGVARHILTAAAQHLVPVTLELGGKSPVLVSRSANLDSALERIMLGKTLNAGQICLAPDYLLVPEESVDATVAAARSVVQRMYPRLLDNPEYTAIINERHYQRLTGYLDELAERGVETVSINPAGEDIAGSPGSRKIAPTLIPRPPLDCAVMQEELFGPLLPILPYGDFEEALHFINSQPRPLAAYYFGSDSAEERALLERTTSGGVCINDVIMHVMQEDLPFGGVGPSGMGAYHGEDGFRRFSHSKAIYRQTRLNIGRIGGMLPPYGDATEKTIRMQVRP